MNNNSDNNPRYRIGICDWSLDAQNVSAFSTAHSIGFDGVQISYGEHGDDTDLTNPTVRDRYLSEAEKYGLQITSMAMTNLVKSPLSYHPDAVKWVVECIECMAAMKQGIVLIPFFGRGDINDRTTARSRITRFLRGLPSKKKLREETIRRLKTLAGEAERNGVVLALETKLCADDIKRFIDEIASPSVRVYYDVGNARLEGYTVCEEIRTLGTAYISQFHLKDFNRPLELSNIDYSAVRDAIEDIGYRGWLIVEASRNKDGDLTEDHKKNIGYIRELFSVD